MSNLYIISTPIGNLDDITYRAVQVLESGLDKIYCEDTRVTSKLLFHLNISGIKLLSCNKESEAKKIPDILDDLQKGKNIALMSDAGTPLISDPGSLILQAVYDLNDKLIASKQKQINIISLPGASALTTALSLSNKDTSRFVFEGFLPHGAKQRRRVLRDLKSEPRTIVFFESPHRIIEMLEDLQNIFWEENELLTDLVKQPSRKEMRKKQKPWKQAQFNEESVVCPKDNEIFVCRELTKMYETKYKGSTAQIISMLREQFTDDPKGEFVVIV